MRSPRIARHALIAVFTVLAALSTIASHAEPVARPRIGVFLWSGTAEQQETAAALREGFELARVEAEIIELSAAGDDAKAHAVLGEFRIESVDVVVAIGDVAALRARNSVRDRPVVFAGAHAPARLGEAFADDLCGTFVSVPADRLLTELRRALPDLSSLAVAVPGGDASATELHDRLVASADTGSDGASKPLRIVATTFPGELSAADAARAALRAVPAECAALLLPATLTADEAKALAGALTGTDAERPLTLVGTTARHLDAGCPLVIRSSPRTAGRRAVGLVRAVLRGRPAGDVGVRRARRVLVEVNIPAATRVGFAPPLTLLVRADRLIPALKRRR